MNTTDDLTRSLQEQADRIGGHPIDLESVRSRARGIKRRRRVAAGAGVLAAVAVLAPIAVTSGGGLTRSDDVPPATQVPSPVGTVKAAGSSAPRGDDPAIPWLDRTVLHQPDGTTTELGKAYYEVTPYDGGWAAVDLAEGTTSFLDAESKPDSEIDEVARVRQSFPGQSLAVSVDGESMATVLTASAGDQDIHLYPVAGAGAGGPLSSVVSFDGTVDLAGFTGDQEMAYTLTGAQGQSGAWITDWAQDPRRLPGLINVQAASQVTGLVSGLTSIDELEPGSCSAVMVAATGQQRWETCDYTLEAFSPDGRYVIGTDAYHDGLGGTTVALLDATDGTVLVEYTTRDIGFIGSSVWENSSSVLVTTYQDGVWYALRLSLDGKVEQALNPVRAGDVDNPWGWGLRP
jgi:hypothetical protein